MGRKPGTRGRTPGALAVAAALVLLGCASGGGGGGTTESLAFAPSLGVDLAAMTRAASGLYLQDLKVGSGEEARVGRQVRVHYAGWLPDGTLFDSSLASGEPVAFVLGRGEVIRGWEEGISGMRVGGARKLVVPPRLGYGYEGIPGTIPPGATLVFQIELLDVGR